MTLPDRAGWESEEDSLGVSAPCPTGCQVPFRVPGREVGRRLTDAL
jgi:hypothetical protein